MKKYDHKKIEKRWQEEWEKSGIYRAHDFSDKPKYYCLVEFPYPSGDGLHTGHVRSYTAMDIVARKRRAEGFNVLYPIGWDAFGLPTENYAIKTKTPPEKVTKANTDTFRRQLKALGLSFDWSREINTTDPKYYKWTQWIFIQMFKKGLAYKKKTQINWCLSCKIGLANEEVVDGKCERCGGQTEKRDKEQWMLAITKYAGRLYDDLNKVDYLEKIKTQQRNWIGPSEGAIIQFPISNFQFPIEVFTTRADTLFGATYMVLAPEHDLVFKLKDKITNWSEVGKYIIAAKKKTEIERTAEGKEKTGVELKGIKAINPANKEEIPVFIADYVLKEYGTGAIMAVPAHDERDRKFALTTIASETKTPSEKYIKQVINPYFAIQGKKSSLVSPAYETINDVDIDELDEIQKGQRVYTGPGLLINSGEFTNLDNEEAKKKITEFVGGQMKTAYKLRDWVFSRQRYWGEPIPVIHCEKCGVVPIPEGDLPVKLPKVKYYEPTGTGESPLAAIEKWVNVKCPICKGKARRETNTMPQWAGSSWYYLRYMDPKNKKQLVDAVKEKYWSPVDIYVGGAEHATRHLIYARFWHKFLYDIGAVSTIEPFAKLQHVGLIMGEDGKKMSKRLGNVVNPDEIVDTYGADTLRIYEMFMGPFDQQIAWSSSSIVGSRRFIEKVWKLKEKVQTKTKEVMTDTENITADSSLELSETDRIIHKTIKKVTEDIDSLRFNTAVSTLMIAVNDLDKQVNISREQFETLLKLLSPFAPHVAEELWKEMGNGKSIHISQWPVYIQKFIDESVLKIVIQINGKTRGMIEIPPDSSKEDQEVLAKNSPEAQKWLEGQSIIKTVVVPGRLVNFVIE